MEDAEVPLENVQEDMHHRAVHSQESWISGVALSSCLIAALAAVTAMLSGHHANEAMIETIHASDHWAQYQAKSIKLSLLNAKGDLFLASGKAVPDKDKEKGGEYKKAMDEIADEAKAEEAVSRKHLETHQVLSVGVTMFQVAIAVAAIAALTKKKAFWFVGLAFGGVGCYFFTTGLLMH